MLWIVDLQLDILALSNIFTHCLYFCSMLFWQKYLVNMKEYEINNVSSELISTQTIAMHYERCRKYVLLLIWLGQVALV